MVGEIESGLLVLLGVERGDNESDARRLIQRVLTYRVFSDEAGRMNRSVLDVSAGVLLVPQFTLPADTRKGRRPSFTPAAAPEEGEHLFGVALAAVKASVLQVQSGRFGADMRVASENDGPVTFWLQVPPSGRA